MTDRTPPSWVMSGRIPSLDGLRGLVVLLVVLCHAAQAPGFPLLGIPRSVWTQGAVGVDVFFVLSGLLITTLLLRERDRTGGVSLRAFWLRRFLRIVPAYGAYLAFIAVLGVAGLVQVGRRDWVAAFTYTVNFLPHPSWEIGHVWSLSIEEHFYLFWPVAAAVSVAFSCRLAWAILATGVVARWAVAFAWPHLCPMTDLWTFTRLDSIAAGCLLAFAARSPHARDWLDLLAGRPWKAALFLAVLALSAAGSMLSGRFAVCVAPTLRAGSLALLVWHLVNNPRGLPSALLDGRVLCGLGTLSYSLYLWQQPFLNHDAPWIAFPANVALALAAAAASYVLVERPALLVKESLSRGNKESSAARPHPTVPDGRPLAA